jgi:hypothetical protein
MVRSTFVPAAFAVVFAVTGVELAAAQLFDDAPRPPAEVPGAPPARHPGRPLPPPSDYPDPSQGGYPEPRHEPPGYPSANWGPPSNVQSEPLPPPIGGEPTDAQQNPQMMQPRSGALGPPPGPRAARGTPPSATVDLQPGDEVVTEPPAQKIANPTAVFSGLDKITGRTIMFDVAVNETVQFGALQVTPRVCYTRPPTETPNTDGFVEVDEITLQGEGRRIFAGWMFAASPGLHAVEHPIYDVWLVDCKGRPSSVASDAAPSAQAVNASSASVPDPSPSPTSRAGNRPRR